MVVMATSVNDTYVHPSVASKVQTLGRDVTYPPLLVVPHKAAACDSAMKLLGSCLSELGG